MGKGRGEEGEWEGERQKTRGKDLAGITSDQKQ